MPATHENSHDFTSNPVEEYQKQKKIVKNQKAEALVAAVEMTDVSLIFGFKEYLALILEGLGHTILFPLAAGASVIRAILKIREAYLEKEENKRGARIRAAVETVAALAISTAVIGTFAATLTFAVLGPIIFTVTLAAKTLFHLGAVIFYAVKALCFDDSIEKPKSIEKMKNNLVLTVVTALTTVAAGLVLIANKASFGILGVIAGALGASYAVYKAFSIKPARSSQVSSEQAIASKALFDDTTTAKKVFEVFPLQPGISLNKTSNSEPKPFTEEQLREKQEQEQLKALYEELAEKRKLISDFALKLEKALGADKALNVLINRPGDQRAKIATHMWTQYKSDKSQEQDHVGLFSQIDENIKAFNSLIDAHKILLENEKKKEVLAAARAARLAREQEERDEESFKMRTGFSKEDALTLGRMVLKRE